MRHGASGNHYTNTVFDDEAVNPIASGVPPFTGTFIPDSSLSAADGLPGAGSWSFKVLDQGNNDTESILNWTLSLRYPDLACVPGGSPPPIPDGSFGAGMTASRVTAAGSTLHLTWDVGTCAATNNHLLYGTLQDVASQALAGGVCGLGPLGSYDWANVPAGNLWFVVVGDDGAGTEGSWGEDGAGAQRNGASASGWCGFTTRDNAGTCP